MAASSLALQVNGSMHKNPKQITLYSLKASLSSNVKPFFKELQKNSIKLDVLKNVKNTSGKLLDALVDSVFRFVDIPLLDSQKNFAPVDEIGEEVIVVCTEGKIPEDFPTGVFIRNGSNPLFGGLKSTVSILGKSSNIWVEGEGMLHAVYFRKNGNGGWTISYNNRHVESETFKLEKERKKPSFLPTVEGDSPSIIAAYFINMLRFGTVNKHMSNTNVFEHSGKVYAVAENYLPQEIDISTLQTLSPWDVNGTWDRPFTSHPKKDPETGELVVLGIDAAKPYYVVGVVSADGKTLRRKVDLKFNRSTFCHEVGITRKYTVIMDCPLIVDLKRLVKGGPLVMFDKDDYARIGVMPRYGNGDSVRWFSVDSNCTLHILNCFEDCDEVVVRGCRSLESVFPGPAHGINKFEWFSRGFKPIYGSTADGFLFTRLYEWRLNMKTGEIKEAYLSSTEFSMDWPFIHSEFTGLEHKYGYTQVVDSTASSSCGMGKYGSLAKFYLNEPINRSSANVNELFVKVEYHKLPKNSFCTGSTFVPINGGIHEDDGWIVSFVHNEDTNSSQVYIIDSKDFESAPIAKITLPRRVPYGFHGTFISMSSET